MAKRTCGFETERSFIGDEEDCESASVLTLSTVTGSVASVIFSETDDGVEFESTTGDEVGTAVGDEAALDRGDLTFGRLRDFPVLDFGDFFSFARGRPFRLALEKFDLDFDEDFSDTSDFDGFSFFTECASALESFLDFDDDDFAFLDGDDDRPSLDLSEVLDRLRVRRRLGELDSEKDSSDWSSVSRSSLSSPSDCLYSPSSIKSSCSDKPAFSRSNDDERDDERDFEREHDRHDRLD